MKIMEIVSGTAVNGAVAHCRLLAMEMVRAGHEVTVVSRPGSWILDHLPPHIETVASSLQRNVTELRRMSRFVAERHFDAIHTHMSGANYFGVLLKYLTGTPSVASTIIRDGNCIGALMIRSSPVRNRPWIFNTG